MITPSQLAEDKALCEKAAEGPWHTGHIGEFDNTSDVDGPDGQLICEVTGSANATLIIRSRTALPAYIEEVEKLKTVTASLVKAIEAEHENAECRADDDCDHCVTANAIQIARKALGEVG